MTITPLPSENRIYLAAFQANLFLALVATLPDQAYVAALEPELELWPGRQGFRMHAFRETQAQLVALEPADLHHRMFACGIAPAALTDTLLSLGLPLTGVTASTPGHTVFIDHSETGLGRILWLLYTASGTEAEAVEAFYHRFFENNSEWEAYGPLRIVVPGLYLHAAVPIGREEGFHLFWGE